MNTLHVMVSEQLMAANLFNIDHTISLVALLIILFHAASDSDKLTYSAVLERTSQRAPYSNKEKLQFSCKWRVICNNSLYAET